MVRKDGWRDGAPLLAALVIYIVFAAGFADWTAGWCAAARHLVPILPIATVVALVGTLQIVDNRWGAAVVAVLVSASGTITLLSIALTPFFPPEFTAPLAQLVLPSLADGVAFGNLLTSVLGLAPVVTVFIVSVLAVAALIWALGRVVGGGRWWLPAVSLATVTVLLLTLTWHGSARGADHEIMRAEVVRRLGHLSAAEDFAAPLPSETPTAD
jgi:hypothetical protein